MVEGLLTLPNLVACWTLATCGIVRTQNVMKVNLTNRYFLNSRSNCLADAFPTIYTLPDAIIKKGIILISIVDFTLWLRVWNEHEIEALIVHIKL